MLYVLREVCLCVVLLLRALCVCVSFSGAGQLSDTSYVAVPKEAVRSFA